MTKAELNLRDARTSAPYWYVQDQLNGGRVIEDLSLAEATAFVQRYGGEERSLLVQRSQLWIEPSSPPKEAA